MKRKASITVEKIVNILLWVLVLVGLFIGVWYLYRFIINA